MDVAGSTEARKDHSKMETTARELTLQCGVIFIANLRERDGERQGGKVRGKKSHQSLLFVLKNSQLADI